MSAMFSVREIIADVRASVVSMITTGAVLFVASIAGAIWKSVKAEPVPWVFVILIGIAGIALLVAATIKLVKAEKTKNVGLTQPIQYPRLRMSCRADIEGCVKQTLFTHERLPTNFFRVKVESEGEKSIKNCTAIFNKHPEGR